MSYICPLCAGELQLQSRSYVCHNRHSFDMAKEGYVNLLPVQQKNSKDPGDNREMMQARRAFLSQHHYAPMREHVAQLLSSQLETRCDAQILDIGCGEGYYTQAFAESVPQAHTYGLDISKVAIRYAAKRYPDVDFCVASSNRLPFAASCLDAIVRIYAPCDHAELLRSLKDGAILITVTPAARHLYQLKQLVYPDVRLHDNSAQEIQGLMLVSQHNLHYEMPLSGVDATHLLQMTPFAWRAKDEVRETLLAKERFTVEADFNIQLYRKG